MQNIRDLYFKIEIDTDQSRYLEMKKDIKPHYQMQNQELKNSIDSLRNKYNDGYFYLGFYICFELENQERFYILHEHESDRFINEIKKVLKEHNAKNIYVKYGDLD